MPSVDLTDFLLQTTLIFVAVYGVLHARQGFYFIKRMFF